MFLNQVGLSGLINPDVGILLAMNLVVSAATWQMSGYVLSKWKFKGSNVLFPLMLFGMFIPYQSILIPLVQCSKRRTCTGAFPA